MFLMGFLHKKVKYSCAIFEIKPQQTKGNHMTKKMCCTSLLLPLLTLCAEAQQSPKRGIAYGQHSLADLNALKTGISWWYNWSGEPENPLNSSYESLGVEFVPMAWGKLSNPDAFIASIKTGAKYLLAFNEPNFNDGARLSPEEAVAAWPAIEKIAAAKGLEIVSASPAYNGPSNYGGYQSPTVWHDAFFRLCPNCKVDYIAFHTYDDTADSVIGVTSNLKKYNIPIWVTEFANRVVQTAAEKTAFMSSVVNAFENDPDIYRYSWFTARVPSSWTAMLEGQLLGSNSGELRPIGSAYLNIGYSSKKMQVPGRITANKHYRRRGTGLQNTTDGGTDKNVCFTDPGDWGEYQVQISKSGTYRMIFRVASLVPGKFDISINGTMVKTNENFQASGDLQSYINKTVNGIELKEGENYIRIHYQSRFNFNYIDIDEQNSLGLEDSLQKTNIIYPNPFKEEATLEIKSPYTESLKIKIIDMKAVTCYFSDQFTTNQKIKIGKELASGIYSVIVENGNKISSYWVIKN